MNKKIFTLSLVIIILGLAIAITFLSPNKATAPTNHGATAALDPLNATYIVDGRAVTLVDGKSSTTDVFGKPVMGDLNGDAKTDAAVFLVENSGGSGTFYFAAAALKTATGTGTQGTDAVFLGDRIAPQSLEIQNGEIVANYIDRGPLDPMSAQPSIGVTKYLVVSGTTLAEK